MYYAGTVSQISHRGLYDIAYDNLQARIYRNDTEDWVDDDRARAVAATERMRTALERARARREVLKDERLAMKAAADAFASLNPDEPEPQVVEAEAVEADAVVAAAVAADAAAVLKPLSLK